MAAAAADENRFREGYRALLQSFLLKIQDLDDDYSLVGYQLQGILMTAFRILESSDDWEEGEFENGAKEAVHEVDEYLAPMDARYGGDEIRNLIDWLRRALDD